jgi:hypothetical protein
MDDILEHKASHSNGKKFAMTLHIISDHNGINLNLTAKEITENVQTHGK